MGGMEPAIGEQYIFCRDVDGITECVRFLRREDGSASVWGQNIIADWDESEDAWKLASDDLLTRGFNLEAEPE